MWKAIKIGTVFVSFLMGALFFGTGLADILWFKAYAFGGIEIFLGFGLYAFSKNLAADIINEEKPVTDDIQIVYRMKW